MFDVDGLARDRIWALGETHVDGPRNKTLYGHAELHTADVVAHGLTVVRTESPERHCNVIDWPAEKEDRMSVAQELAQAADLVLKL